MVEDADLDVAGNNAEKVRFCGGDPEYVRIIGVVSVDGMGEDVDLIEPVGGDALAEVVDVGVAALVPVGVRHFVDAKVAVVVDGAMRVIELGALAEVIGEVPSLFLGFVDLGRGLSRR